MGTNGQRLNEKKAITLADQLNGGRLTTKSRKLMLLEKQIFQILWDLRLGTFGAVWVRIGR